VRVRAIGLVLLAAALAAALPASAQTNGPGPAASGRRPLALNAVFNSLSGFTDKTSTNSVTATFTVTGAEDDGGGNDSVRLVIYDDQSVKAQKTFQIPVGTRQTITTTLSWSGPIGTQAPGVGVYLYDSGMSTGVLAYVDPFLLSGEKPLTVDKSAPTSVVTGQLLTYTLTYGNTTSAAINSVVIQDTVPSGTSFASATGGGTLSNGVVTWNIGTIAASTTGLTVQLSVMVTAASGQVVNDTYSISGSGVSSISGAAVVTSVTPCTAPSAPTVSAASSVPSGQSISVSWSVPTDLAAGGSYVVETSKDGFAHVDTSTPTTATSIVIPTTVSATAVTLSVRVHAVQACGAAGASSTVVTITITATTASFEITQAGPSWTALVGAAPGVRPFDVPPTATVTFKNVGAIAGHLQLAATGGFFTLSASGLDVAPGQFGSVVLTANVSALTQAGFFEGSVVATSGAQVLTTPVTLAVAAHAASPGTKSKASKSGLLFRAAAGQSPGIQTITITVSPNGAGTQLAAMIGPGGSWLVLGPELRAPVPDSGTVTLSLAVDRSKRSPNEVGPIYRTVLQIYAVGADSNDDAATIEIRDVDTLTVVSAAGQRGGGIGTPPPGGSSFILGTAVNAVSGQNTDQVFTSDGFVKNLGTAPATVDIFCATDGSDGNTQVVKVTTTIPPGGTLRLSDLMNSLFQAVGVSANIEIRTATPAFLTFRATADSIIAGQPQTKFGTEIAVVAFGFGASLGGPEFVLPGIDDDLRNRANLILAETAGAAADVVVTVYAEDGTILGTQDVPVRPFSKTQLNGVVKKILNTTLQISGGSLGVRVVSGAGHVEAIATLIDNLSGSFSGILGRAPKNPAGAGTSGRSALVASDRYLMPAVARTLGQFNTHFITNMSIVNGTATAATLFLTYNYVDQDDGGTTKSVTKTVVLPPRGSLPKVQGTDVIASLFGVTNRSYGSIQMQGDVASTVAVATVGAQVDPNDASKGFKNAQVNGTSLDAPAIASAGAVERRFTGIEKSPQKRTNLVLLEVDGHPATVTVRINSATGQLMAQKSYTLGPNEYRQITDVFGTDGVDLGDGPFQNVEVTAQVQSGSGRVLGLASVIDNISRNPEIFVLTVPGPPADPSIGF
jgi:uncharacterized repeat protein (TIGR01451 family)